MELSGLQIFKYTPAAKKLPESNCKKCGCPTCMIFSLKLAKNQIDLSCCPYISQEFMEVYNDSIKQPQDTITIGNLKIGGENVLYRHEKTFINPTVLAIIVDCVNSDWQKMIKQVCDFKVTRINVDYGVDLVILKNFSANNVEMTNLLKNNSQINFIAYEDLQDSGLNMVLEDDFQTTKDFLIKTRTKAILEKDEKYRAPVAVLMKNDDFNFQCARASYYLCKYANMIVFEEFNPELLSTLIMLRQNIFTDPQKTLQIEPELYKFNNPDKESIVFLTTNFALTYYAVASELEKLSVPSYLIIVPTKGMSVLTAWSAQTLNSEIIAQTIDQYRIREILNTRKIIIPGLIADMKNELQQACPDFEFVEGTKDASDISKFVENMCKI